MVRNDHRGVTSTITALRLRPGHYSTMLHFFRSKAYKVDELYRRWVDIAQKKALFLTVSGRMVLLGDHIKISKEGRRMPCVGKHHQDSQNSGKAEYIEGHNYGQISAVITNGTVSRSLPLMAEIQESKAKTGGDSLIQQMIQLAGKCASAAGTSAIVVLDAYFCSGSAWKSADGVLDADGDRLLEIVTRAKASYTAYYPPEPCERPKPGRPRKYGEKVKLSSLFSENAAQFAEQTMTLYGKTTKVRFLCIDLIWKPAARLCRFVLVQIGSTPFVLMSSDLALSPEEVILLYANRFKIETGFDDQKNDVGGFAYHFWTKSLPKRKRFKSSPDTGVPDDPKKCQNIAGAKRATEAFVCLSIIATGILTIIAFDHSSYIWNRYPGFLRTRRCMIPSVASVKLVLSDDFCSFLPALSSLEAFSFIPFLQRTIDFLYACA